MEEVWKDIKDYEGYYQVSNLGRVRSLDRVISRNGKNTLLKGQLLTIRLAKCGYLYCGLSKNGKHTLFRVHRLVAEAFIPNPNNLPQVNHKSEDKADNSVDNLEWCDAKYNCNYGERTKKCAAHNLNHPNKSKWVIKLSKDNEILHFYPSTMEAHRQTGISRTAIMKCCLGKPNYKTAGGYIWKYAI